MQTEPAKTGEVVFPAGTKISPRAANKAGKDGLETLLIPTDQIFGFRRSPTEIQAAEIGDFPATASKTDNFRWTFETVAKGDDNLLIYGGVKWSFGVNAGKLVNDAFTGKAPEAVVAKVRDRLAAAEADIARINEALAALPS